MAVRAMAPVAGRPPNSGETMLAMPCAISSTLGLCRSPLMRSATTADISDSIAPSMATVSAGESSAVDQVRRGMRDSEMAAARWGCRRTACRWFRPAARSGHGQRSPRSRATIVAGNPLGRQRGTAASTASDAGRQQRGRRRKRAAARSERLHPRQNSPGTLADLQAEEILDLRAGDQHRDAVGEADDDRPRDELDRRAHAGQRRERSGCTPAITVHMYRPSMPCFATMPADHHDERAGRPADLGPRAAQRGDQEAGDHRAVDPGLRRDSGANGERHRQRQGHQADRHPGRGTRVSVEVGAATSEGRTPTSA